MPDEPSTFEVNGSRMSYKDLWSDRVDLFFFHEIEEHTGSFTDLGKIESGADDKRRFFDLKGIEFSPKGLPTFTWAEEIKFVFLPNKDEPDSAFEVTIDRNTGLAHVTAVPAPKEDEE